MALDDGWAINIGGGFNHYSVNESVGHGGLNVYDDVLICLTVSYVKAIILVTYT